jgi:integrative and conjugative element protein (TIGR02256 family)
LTQVVWLPDNAARLIARDAERWGLRETGGPLFGYEACGELVVTEALLPGPKATHLPFLFRPDRDAVDRAIAEIYERSGGGERWIGSWHSHPFGRAHPSLLDRRTAGRVAREAAVDCPRPLMLIQTTRPSRRGPRADILGSFRWTPGENDLVEVGLRAGTVGGEGDTHGFRASSSADAEKQGGIDGNRR